MLTSIRRSVILTTALAVLAVAAFAGASAAQAATCSPPTYRGSGYFTSMSARNVSCATAAKVVKSYYSCRIKKGKTGRCTSKVRGYSCRETRQSIPTELNARVTCKRGSRTVVHTYQQNL
jgi:hypothetical protein